MRSRGKRNIPYAGRTMQADAWRWRYRETWRRQAPIPARESGEKSGFSGRMGLHGEPEGVAGFSFWAICDNVWNDAMERHIGQPVPGRRFFGGMGTIF